MDMLYTPEDLLRLPDADHYELVDGKLINTWSSGLASWTTCILMSELGKFVADRKLGVVLAPTAQYRCFPDDTNRIRKPDLSFIERSRIPSEFFIDFIAVAPDLAVEVVSDHDLVDDLKEKVREYLCAGVKMVWVADPATKSVCVYRLSGTTSRLLIGDELSGEDVLPGFSLPTHVIFELPPGLAV